MNRPQRRARSIAVAATTLALLAWACFGQDPAIAPGADLLRSTPFDRITLTDGTVLNVEPISPRPLPPLDPGKGKSKTSSKPELIRIGEDPPRAKPKGKAKEDDEAPLTELSIHLLQGQGEQRDFTVKRANVRQIDYFEDLLLAEVDRLVLARDYTRAFECCLRVDERDPAWKGLDEHVNRLLFAEGTAALLDSDTDRGLRLLHELFDRKPDYPGLADKLAASYGGRLERAFDLGLYPRARTILRTLERLAPEHALTRAARDRFVTRARDLMHKAESLPSAERLDALAEALRVWPTLDGAADKYAAAFKVEPTLDVAVVDVPRALGPRVQTSADARVMRLLFLPLLARDDDESAQGQAAGQLAEALTASDLGRKLTVKLRSGIIWSDGPRPISAVDVARSLTDRIEPTSTAYNARWAELLDHVEILDESQVAIRLTRPTLKPGFWLLGPVGPAHAGFDGRVATLDHGRQLVGDGPYRETATTAEQFVMRADRLKVRRVRETRIAKPGAALGALLRGDVSLLEHVPPDRVAGLAANPEFKVGRYTLPTVHRIAIDGRSPALRNRALRRGLSYAIDRKTLLEEVVLKRPADAVNAVADGPFPKGSYADAPDVPPLGYDPLLAKMLIAAARKELGGQPIQLTFQYPSVPEAQAVAPKLVEALKLVGVALVATERPESELEADLRAGKRFDLAYRASTCAEPVLEAGPLLCPGCDAVPSTDALASVASPRTLQLLLQLERAPEWPTAKGLVLQIDRECRDELPILPLWQLQDHYAWRGRLKGPAASAESLYQGIESWEIEPWFAIGP